MNKLFFDFITGTIHRTVSTRSNVHVFSNGEKLEGPEIYYFWEGVNRFKNMYVAKSVHDAKLNNVKLFVSPRGCRHEHLGIRTDDNNCLECETIKRNKKLDGRATETTKMMCDYPDMIIDYDTAKRLKFKVYRTGEPCFNGHKGYRYVRNKTCIECSRGY